MGRFYQDELGSSLGPGAAPSPATGAAAAAAPPQRVPAAAVPGRTKATFLHQLVPIGGPVGLAISVVVGLFAGRDPRPLVSGTERAILRFVAQLVVLLAVGVALTLAEQKQWAIATFSVMAGAYLFLPVVAAVWTYATGRVFRYPLWDLVRRPRR
jgi:hypothetical protein